MSPDQTPEPVTEPASETLEPHPFERIQNRINHRAASIQAARNRRGIRTGPTQAAIIAERQILSELKASHEHNKGMIKKMNRLHSIGFIG